MTASPARRRDLSAAVIFAALLLGVVLGWQRLAQSRAAENEAAQDLQLCRAAVARIEALRSKPRIAEQDQTDTTDVSRRLEQAAGGAGIGSDRIERIEPEPPQQVAGTAYRRKPVRVRLERVSLQELFTFLHSVAADGTGGRGRRVADIRLSAPRGEEAGERWNVEAVLDSLVYDPKSAAQAVSLVDR